MMARWQLVLPVKGGEAAKSRLGPLDVDRPALALAIALDCVEAVVATPAVDVAIVVTADLTVADATRALGARVVPESSPGSGLAQAVRDGVAATRAGPVAVLLADLPALTPEALAQALFTVGAALADGATSVVVPDAEGTGSVLLAAADAAHLHPSFGAASARSHVDGGALRLDLDAPRVRRDVDTPAALRDAVALGVGPRTRTVLVGAVA